MSKHVIPAVGFTREQANSIGLVGFMSWGRLIELLQKHEVSARETLAGIVIEPDGITLKVKNKLSTP